MSKMLKPGEPVEWRTPQGRTWGKVAKKITSTRYIRGHKAAATPGDPQFLVVSEKSGRTAAHKPGALRKIRR